MTGSVILSAYSETLRYSATENVLVAAPAYSSPINDWQANRGDFADMRQRVRRLKRRNNTFQPGDELKRFQRLLIRCRDIGNPPSIAQIGVFRPG